MIRSAPTPRWAIPFADLCLLLLGFFVILHARSVDPHGMASIRTTFGGTASDDLRSYPAAALFEPGEAVFRRGADRPFVLLGERINASRGRVRVESAGTNPGALRFDGWELAAARAAAVARAIRAGGLDERRIEVAIPPSDGVAGGQTISVIL